MGIMRRGSSRPGSVRRSRLQGPEVLESRQLLASNIAGYLSPYIPSDLYVRNPITNQREFVSAQSLQRPNDPNGPLVSNQGKIVSGKDRAGNEYTITVHGPGQVIVTDTTPNDGALDDDIATIQIVGSNIRSTYVTGSTVASARTLTNGVVKFNQLIAAQGVKSIQLNGFDLTNSVSPAQSAATGIFLHGGVQTLQFHDIVGIFDQSTGAAPYQITIGDPNVPLKVKPSIYLDSIYNSVFDSTSDTIPTTPITTPYVQFSINGTVQNFSIVSATQSAVAPNYIAGSQDGTVETWSGYPVSGPPPAAYQFFYNIVGTTGRTSLQALAVDNLKVRGSAKNFTAQKNTTPFTSSESGLRYLRRATFGGNADAVALDVNGNIGDLTFKKGLGDPTGVYTASATVPSTSETGTATQTQLLPATNYGIPAGSTGYPAAGDLGGVVRARNIRSIRAKAADVHLITAQNPDFVSLNQPGTPDYVVQPGTAMTNTAITTDGSINHVNVTGNLLNSEIKTGFNYQTYLQGLQGTRRASRIASYKQNGDLVNSVVSATYIPANGVYNQATGTAGRGQIRGHVRGFAYGTGGRTALGNYGAGVFARSKIGRLPVSP
ncbi:MAG: hypothetical protein P4L85_09620 [Paludisphaera borealis]|uniref:hypothetical protein n=1 Tax=Paludisphaera borealis TaxID=1387353 RepID=UPI0028442A7C|nr:hypothetical protein [Paludisphaera borealis]MDR3619597.1 hypothetical protein [Paludisphaera borealis]